MATIADNGSASSVGSATPVVVSDQFAGGAAVYAALVGLENIGTDSVLLEVLVTVNGGTAGPYKESFTGPITADAVTKMLGPFPTEDEFAVVFTQTSGASVYAIPFSVIKIA